MTEEERVINKLVADNKALRDLVDWQAAENKRLRGNIEVALQHALSHWKENGCKADDQLGVIALVLATTLEKIDGSAMRWHSTAALGEGKE
jgi:hypothetical protein